MARGPTRVKVHFSSLIEDSLGVWQLSPKINNFFLVKAPFHILKLVLAILNLDL